MNFAIYRRTALGLALAMTAIAACADDPFPSKPIRILVPFQAGGLTDLLARRVALRLSTRLKTEVVVDNRPGANGVIAAKALATAKPDGYTLGYFTSSMYTTVPFTVSGGSYSPADIPPIIQTLRSPLALVVGANTPHRDIKSYLADARKDNKPLLLGMASSLGLPRVQAMTLSQSEGVKLDVVGYPGVPALSMALRSGDLPAAFDMTAAFYNDYKAGVVRILAVSSENRIKSLPDVPTFKESGFSGQTVYGWHAIATPANMPADVNQKLYAALREIVTSKEFEALVVAQSPDMEPSAKNGVEMAAQISAEQAVAKPILQKLDAAK